MTLLNQNSDFNNVLLTSLAAAALALSGCNDTNSSAPNTVSVQVDEPAPAPVTSVSLADTDFTDSFTYSDPKEFVETWKTFPRLSSASKEPTTGINMTDGYLTVSGTSRRATEDLFPVDENGIVTVSFDYEPVSGDPDLLVGLIGYAEDGTTMVNRNGEDTRGDHYYIPGPDADTSTIDRTLLSRTYGFTAANPTETTPRIYPLHPDVAFVRPLIISSYRTDSTVRYHNYSVEVKNP